MQLIFTLIIFILSATTVFAQGGYTPIVGIPGLQNTGGLTTQQYVEALYKLSISVGAILAVIQIIYAGVEYMLTDVITSKSNAIKRIRGALFGLLIILGAVLLLQTINPNLLNLNIFNNAPPLSAIRGASPTQAKTACEVDARSKACCSEKKGIYSQNGGSQSTCLAATADTTPTGDTNTDKSNCEIAGNLWNDTTKVCTVNDGKSFNYSSIVLTNGRYEIPLTLNDQLSTDKLKSTLEVKCLLEGKSGVDNGKPTGTNIVYSCE